MHYICLYTFFFSSSAERHCGNDVLHLNTTFHKEGNTTYDCVYNDKDKRQGIKQVQCGTGCQEDSTGKHMCCREKVVTKIKKNFLCTPRNGGPSVNIELERERRSRCECFYCEEICSMEEPSSATLEPNAIDNHHDATRQTNILETLDTK